MADGQDEALAAALQRVIAGEQTGEDMSRVRQAVAEGRIRLARGERNVAAEGYLTGSTALTADDDQVLSHTGGVNFGQSNQIQISGSVIGTITISLPSAAEANRLLDSLNPFRPEPPPPREALPEPGALPPGSRLPFPRNAVFTGREDDLRSLADRLLYQAGSAAVTGTGGLGKTQLAVEFCYRYGRFLHGVHWLHANQDMMAETAACGIAMGLRPWPEALSDQAEVTLREWSRGGPRLVILDNVEAVEVVQEWLPRLPGARVLLTSRQRDWPPDLGLAQYPLDTLSRPQSRLLLRKLAPRLEKVPDEDLDEIAARLGDLPLALDLAGRYLGDRRRLSPAGFLNELDRAGNALAHSALQDWTRHNPTKHETNLAATFSLSWRKLGSRAHRLFCAAGYCAANTPIPWEAFYLLEGAEEGQGQGEVDKELGALEDGGLLSLAEEGALIHPLLAEFARLQDGEVEERALPDLALALAALSQQANESGLPAHSRPLQAHLETTAGWAEKNDLELTSTLWNNLGSSLKQAAEYGGAKEAFERALRNEEATFGVDHISSATTISNLGTVLQDLGDPARAKTAHERALRITEATYGMDHAEVAIRLNNLGTALKELGDLSGAKAAFERALRIEETNLGLQDPRVATAGNNLGVVLRALGDYNGAKLAFERTLRIDIAAFGPDHPRVASVTGNLGLVLQALGDAAGAKTAFEQALRIDEAVFGPEHPAVARNLSNLATALQDMGDYNGAKAALERALSINEATFGPDHPSVATVASNLGSLLYDLGDYAGAKAALERALRIDEAAFGPDHPEVALRANNLGNVLQSQGDFSGAKAAYERALQIDEAAFGPHHARVAIRLNNLGNLLQDLGDYSGARTALERALAIDETIFGPNHPTIANVVNNLGTALMKLGDLAEAQSCFERALRIDETAYGPDHPHVAIRLNNLGSVLRDLGDFAGAKAAFERALRIDEAAFGSDHPKLAKDFNNLGSVLEDMGDYTGAKAAYEKALRIAEPVLGLDHPQVAIFASNLGGLLRRLADLAGAKAAYERALRIDEAAYGPDHPDVAAAANNLGRVLYDLGDYPGAKAAFERSLAIYEKSLPPDHPNIRLVCSNLEQLQKAGPN